MGERSGWWPLEEEELCAIEAAAQQAHNDAPGFNRCADDVLKLATEVRHLERVIFGLRRSFGMDPNWPDEAENVWSKDHA